MAKNAIVQIRMDEDLKNQVEELYKSMGTSFAEAVRIFAKQSLLEQGMPFMVTTEKRFEYDRMTRYAYYFQAVEELAAKAAKRSETRSERLDVEALLDSITGIIPDEGKALHEYRQERLKKYEDID